jgi:hypothetical protein
MYDYYMYVYVYVAASVYILVGFKVGPHNHQCSTTFKQPANADDAAGAEDGVGIELLDYVV